MIRSSRACPVLRTSSRRHGHQSPADDRHHRLRQGPPRGLTAQRGLSALYAREKERKKARRPHPGRDARCHDILYVAGRHDADTVVGGRGRRSADAQRTGPDLVFKTSDGYITAGPCRLRMAGLLQGVGRPELAKDPRCVQHRQRGFVNATAPHQQDGGIISPRDSTAEWRERLDAADVPARRSCARGGLIRNEQVVASDIIAELITPTRGGSRARGALRSNEGAASRRAGAPRRARTAAGIARNWVTTDGALTVMIGERAVRVAV